MNDLLSRIRSERWHMVLLYDPHDDDFLCMLDSRERSVTGRNALHEVAIVEAIGEMDK